MMKAVILICAATLSPQDCTRQTAEDVLIVPVSPESFSMCARVAQKQAASSLVGERARADGLWIKVECRR